jgi:cell pole-organizing protein PopZ
MEDLLASIRRAIREEDQASMQVANRAPARSERQEARLPGTPAPVMSAADDIKLLRDKINSELARAEPRLQAAALAVNSPKPFTSLFRAPQPVAQPAPVRQPQAVAAPAPMPTPEPLRLRPRLPEMTDYAPVARSAPAPSPSPSREQRLLSPRVAEATASAFGRLSESRNLESGFEQMTREMLRPMLRHWLDTHLPNIVERLVREEIERVARRGR